MLDPNEIKTDGRYEKVSNDDFRIEWFSGTGKGGQHRNKKKNSCRVIHVHTGLCETRQGRKRDANLQEAKAALLTKLEEKQYTHLSKQSSHIKKEQRGSGMRGDKIRTYRFQDDQVIDHQTGKTAKATKVMKGRINLLW